MTAATELRNELERAGFDFDVIEHGQALTARDEASAVGVPPGTWRRRSSSRPTRATSAPSSPRRNSSTCTSCSSCSTTSTRGSRARPARFCNSDVRAGRGTAVRRPAGDPGCCSTGSSPSTLVAVEAAPPRSVGETADLLALAKAEVVDIAKGAPPALAVGELDAEPEHEQRRGENAV